MIFILIIVALAFSGLCCWFAEESYEFEEFGTIGGIIGACITICLLIWAVVLGYEVTELKTLDDQIAMYEAENKEIETQIETAVLAYQKYESDIFEGLKSESYITLVSLYPELKSDTLVQKQIEVYIANNETIKSLKEKKIKGTVKKWWLYFGG